MVNEKDIPDSVIQGLEEIRQNGKYNMLCESQNVFNELYKLGYYEDKSVLNSKVSWPKSEPFYIRWAEAL